MSVYLSIIYLSSYLSVYVFK